MHPKNKLKIGNWNVRTLNPDGNDEQVARVMRKMKIDIMGISETHWTGQGRLRLSNGESIIYSGREDGLHRQGVGIMMSHKADLAMID